MKTKLINIFNNLNTQTSVETVIVETQTEDQFPLKNVKTYITTGTCNFGYF